MKYVNSSRHTSGILASLALFTYAGCGLPTRADVKPMIDFGAPGALSQIAPNSAEGSAFKIVNGDSGKALEVTCTAGTKGSPGVAIKPEGGAWDLTGFGEVDADVTNLSAAPLAIFIRVNNPGNWQGGPWDQDRTSIPAGKSATVKAVFGYSWGNVGYALDPSKVIQVLLFTGKLKADAVFRVTSLHAGGKPGEKPANFVVKNKPAGGILTDFGASFQSSQLESRSASTSLSPGAAVVTFQQAPSYKPSGVLIKAAEGNVWDLTDYDQVEVTLSDPSREPVHVFCTVANSEYVLPGDEPTGEATLAPGATKTVLVPFVAAKPWDGNDKTSGSHASAGGVLGVFVSSDASGVGKTVLVRKIAASVSPAPPIPDWVGQRPPVAGNWTKTLDDEFDGTTLDPKIWVVPQTPTASIWDSMSVNVSQNATVSGGMLHLTVEKPSPSPTYSDPSLNTRKYVSTVVTSYGKWTQRYGYFEARMKLPSTLGTWPAFWLMPDRGPAGGKFEWQREDTKNGGMEFDIMEYLARFGPYHYNIAMHYDGYGKLHKAVGTENVYFHPDKDGFVTSGVLIEPGCATFYCNGQMVGTWKSDRIGVTPEYILFTLPLGGWGTNGYVDDAHLPATFSIDYVRAWQRDDLAALPAYDPKAPVPVPTPAASP